MNAQRQALWPKFGTWTVVSRFVSSTGTRLTARLGRRAALQYTQASVEQYNPTRHIEAEALFVRALCEDSNHEVEWLWLATQVVREHERRYCYERVLHINPYNRVARVELARLGPIPAHAKRMAGLV